VGVAHCVDVGSTFTKGVAVDLTDGTLVATADHPTTLPSRGGDVMDGVKAITGQLAAVSGHASETLACSSAGGGLRLAVVGYERAVTAEAGYRVGLSAGARVVHIAAGPLDPSGVGALRAAQPDVVLLVGGTDGGNADVLLHNATRLSRVAVPVVLAGNAEASDAAAGLLGRRVVVCDNVLPRIGVLDPGPARAAIREVFLRHVIGGKHLSRDRAFAGLVQGATPDVVLTGVEALADAAGDVLVVDVGGATTDVYSVVTPEGEDAVLLKEVVATLRHARTVEGDLGMRWNAPGVVRAGIAERLVGDEERASLGLAAGRLATDPGRVPDGETGWAIDERLATLAVTAALRRHGRPTSPSSSARDLRRVTTVVGSGGVLRHGSDDMRRNVLAATTGDHGGGWRVPTSATSFVDADYVLFAAGLLRGLAPAAAAALVTTALTQL
jgi:uncharacterized protein (TIGR01319 family)